MNSISVKDFILSFLLGYDPVKAIGYVSSTFKPSICVIKCDIFLIIINLFATRHICLPSAAR